MNIRTGQTVYEQIISLDSGNNPVTGVTFDTAIYRNGFLYSGITVDINISNASHGAFSASWSAFTIGSYQLYVKNNFTSVVFLSNTVLVKTDRELSTIVYIGT